jgi:hypothetical protein
MCDDETLTKGINMNQRNATVNTILSVLKERGVEYELNGPTPISEVLTETDKKTIREIVFAGFRSGEIDMAADSKEKHQDDKLMKNYVSGLVNNWIRKAPEFNGDVKYESKNKGSRQGSGDEQIKEMKKLLNATTDQTTKSVIQSAINDRLAEIKPSSVVEIDTSKLPESLRHLVK